MCLFVQETSASRKFRMCPFCVIKVQKEHFYFIYIFNYSTPKSSISTRVIIATFDEVLVRKKFKEDE